MRTRLTENDWLKLRDFNKRITANIMPKLPSDWYLTNTDVEGAVYDTIIHLLSTYRRGAQSPVSYVWQYAEEYTLRDLFREYRKLKNQDDVETELSDEEEVHKIGKGTVKALSTDDREKNENKDMVNVAMEQASDEDRQIMKLILEGFSYEDIARKFNIKKMDVTRRMRKYTNILY